MRCLQAVVVLAGVATGALRPLRSRALRQPSPRRKAHVSRTALAVPRGGALEPIELAGHVAVGFWSFGSTIAAGRAQMDCVGCLVIAFLGTLGGSTMRDLMLSRRVFWVADPSYLATLGVTSLLTFALYPWIAHNAGFGGTKRTAVQLLLELPDATGMAFYSVYGAWIALHCCPERSGVLVAVLMGLCTSTFASLIADPLCGRTVRLLRAGESLYAAPALLASTIYAVWDGVAPASAVPVGSYVAFAVALVLRVAAVAWDWKLPVWLANGEARTRGGWFSSRRQTFYFERPAGESDEANKS